MKLDRRLLGATALNPFSGMNSSSRSQMFLSQFSQVLALESPEPVLILSGLEGEMCKLLLNSKMPANVEILEIVAKFAPNASEFPTLEEAMVIDVFYLDLDNHEIGFRHVVKYNSYDKSFGFEHKLTDTLNNLEVKDKLRAGTKLTTTNSDINDVYSYGINVKVLPISRQETAEDAILISRSLAEKFTYHTYKTHRVSVGGKRMPLNAHGKNGEYKVFPDFMESAGDSGVLMAVRDISKHPEMFLILDDYDISPTFDDIYPLAGDNGTVVDIKVLHTPKNKDHVKLTGVYEQIEGYAKADKMHREDFVATVARLEEAYRGMATISSELHVQVVNYLKIDSPKIINKYRQADMSVYTIEITVRYRQSVKEGSKITNRHGGKGIIAGIIEDHLMPVDANGIRAELLMDPKGTPSRMNLGSKPEGYLMSVVYLVGNMIKEMRFNNEDAFTYMTNFVKLINPSSYEAYMSLSTRDREKVMKEIDASGFHALLPIDGEIDPFTAMLNVSNSEYALDESYVDIPLEDGTTVRSYNKAYVETQYLFLPNKDANSWLSVASSYLNVKGVPVAPSRLQREKLPWNATPVKGASETESRFIPYYAGVEALAEIRDRNLNNVSFMAIYENILKANKPTDIETVIDRNEYPLGNENVLKLTESLLASTGLEFDIGYDND